MSDSESSSEDEMEYTPESSSEDEMEYNPYDIKDDIFAHNKFKQHLMDDWKKRCDALWNKVSTKEKDDMYKSFMESKWENYKNFKDYKERKKRHGPKEITSMEREMQKEIKPKVFYSLLIFVVGYPDGVFKPTYKWDWKYVDKQVESFLSRVKGNPHSVFYATLYNHLLKDMKTFQRLSKGHVRVKEVKDIQDDDDDEIYTDTPDDITQFVEEEQPIINNLHDFIIHVKKKLSSSDIEEGKKEFMDRMYRRWKRLEENEELTKKYEQEATDIEGILKEGYNPHKDGTPYLRFQSDEIYKLWYKAWQDPRLGTDEVQAYTLLSMNDNLLLFQEPCEWDLNKMLNRIFRDYELVNKAIRKPDIFKSNKKTLGLLYARVSTLVDAIFLYLCRDPSYTDELIEMPPKSSSNNQEIGAQLARRKHAGLQKYIRASTSGSKASPRVKAKGRIV